MPRPTLPKMMYVASGGCASVKPNTGPRNGPLHGVASSVVKMPLKNAPAGPSCCCSLLDELDWAKPGIGTSHTPRKLRANANTTTTIATLNQVYVNCCPQPRFGKRRGRRQDQKHRQAGPARTTH